MSGSGPAVLLGISVLCWLLLVSSGALSFRDRIEERWCDYLLSNWSVFCLGLMLLWRTAVLSVIWVNACDENLLFCCCLEQLCSSELCSYDLDMFHAGFAGCISHLDFWHEVVETGHEQSRGACEALASIPVRLSCLRSLSEKTCCFEVFLDLLCHSQLLIMLPSACSMMVFGSLSASHFELFKEAVLSLWEKAVIFLVFRKPSCSQPVKMWVV